MQDPDYQMKGRVRPGKVGKDQVPSAKEIQPVVASLGNFPTLLTHPVLVLVCMLEMVRF